MTTIRFPSGSPFLCSIRPGRLAAWFAVLPAVFLLSSCSHYRLGHGGEIPFDSIFVAPAENTSYAPQAQAALTASLRRTLLQDGRLTLASAPETADVLLQVEITGYQREPVAVESSDTGLARKFDVALVASGSLIDRRSGRPYFVARPFQVERGVFRDSGLVLAEYETMPVLTEALADRIAAAVLDVW